MLKTVVLLNIFLETVINCFYIECILAE